MNNDPVERAGVCCYECGISHGKVRESSGCTFWKGICDICHKHESITSGRHYGWPVVPTDQRGQS
jgi:hypothetical protein